ncbi:MAG: arylesterase [Nitrospiraceae bacterium]|nr:arylesterase [Nitrospiraceae bacterium]
MKRRIRFAAVIAVLILPAQLLGCEQRKETATVPQQNRSTYQGTIVAMGDSLTAGFGVIENDAYPAQLERKLQAAGLPWKVVNAGISGETSSGALSRVNWVLKLKPDIVILETGANDGLRGIDPRVTQRNIDETLRILKENHVLVVLAGMRMVRNLGSEYTDAFHAIYPRLAREHDVLLIPFFLQGVAGESSLNQKDGIHPTAEGYRIITEAIYPYVFQAIKRYQEHE